MGKGPQARGVSKGERAVPRSPLANAAGSQRLQLDRDGFLSENRAEIAAQQAGGALVYDSEPVFADLHARRQPVVAVAVPAGEITQAVVEFLAPQSAIGIRPPHQGKRLVLLPQPHARHAEQLLAQHVERLLRHAQRFALPALARCSRSPPLRAVPRPRRSARVRA